MAVPNFTPYQGQQLAQEGDFYKENPYQDRWGGQANKFLNSKPQLSAQDILGRGEGYAAKLGQMGQGWRQFSPNDPMIGQFQSNMMGGLRNSMDQYTGQAANAGVAAGRGGYGVAGGTPQAAMLSRQGTQAIAGQYPQIYGQAAGLTKQSVDVNNQQLQLMIPLIAQMYGVGLGEAAKMASSMYATDINAGTNLAGLSERGYENWFNQAGGANQRDVGNYNTAMMGDYARSQGMLNDQTARTDKQRAANQQEELMMKMKRGMTPWGLTNNPSWDEGYGLLNMGGFMKNQGGAELNKFMGGAYR